MAFIDFSTHQLFFRGAINSISVWSYSFYVFCRLQFICTCKMVPIYWKTFSHRCISILRPANALRLHFKRSFYLKWTGTESNWKERQGKHRKLSPSLSLSLRVLLCQVRRIESLGEHRLKQSLGQKWKTTTKLLLRQLKSYPINYKKATSCNRASRHHHSLIPVNCQAEKRNNF